MVRQFHCLVLATLLIASGERLVVAAADEAKPPALDDAQIKSLIAQLDSNRYLVREQATQALLAAGAAALDPLLGAANGDRPEPADRAVWVLRKLSESEDRQLALSALERLIQVKGRPAVVQAATLARSRMFELACQESLAKLGGRLTVVDAILPEHGPVRLVMVELRENWRGTPKDLECLAALRDHRFFRIEGSSVGNAEIKLFEAMEDLALLQIWKTRVTPAAVDVLKERRPKTTIYVRNQALLGIGGATSAQGVSVTEVRPDTGAAAAGIVPGDVITRLDGQPVKDFDRLTARIAQYQPGQEIEVGILRGTEKLTKRVTLSDWARFDPGQ